MKKTLRLRRDTLTALTGDDLTAVAGAIAAQTPNCPETVYVLHCLTIDRGCSHTCTEE